MANATKGIVESGEEREGGSLGSVRCISLVSFAHSVSHLGCIPLLMDYHGCS